MNTLSIETSSNWCSVAVASDHGCFEREEVGAQIHSEVLWPWIKELMSQAALSYEQLDRLVVGNGPGGFTSLRMGLSLVQGIALAHALPIYPVSSLLNVASQCAAAKRALVIMDARMGEVYTQRFEHSSSGKWVALDKARVIAPEAVHLCDDDDDIALMGNGLHVYPTLQGLKSNKRALLWDPEVRPTAVRAMALIQDSVTPWQLNAHYVRNQVTS